MGSSDSDSESRKRKKEKKHKKDKKHKKHKKNKKRKHSSSSESEDASPVKVNVQKFYETAMRAPIASVSTESFGPALPPHLLKKSSEAPAAPPKPSEEKEDDNDFSSMVGPMPGSSRTKAEMELEQRALEIKLGKLSKDSSEAAPTAREEWMLELPEVGIKGGLESLKRVFKTKEGPDFSDRSDWTTVPNESNEFHKFEKKKKKEGCRSEAEIRAEKERDEEQEKMAKKHRKDGEKSLLELHQEELNEKRKKKGKGEKVERRRFDRDIDLQLNKIDKSHTKKIVDGTKFLDSKFGSGRAKYL